LRVGEYRNLTLQIVSRGYEGNLHISDPNFTWIGEGPQNALEYQIIPSSDESSARFIQAAGELTLTLRIRWTGLAGTIYLSVATYGNYQRENEFKVVSNSVKVTITLPP